MSEVYKVNELFQTIQGEGSFTGQPSIFIRLQQCPVGCSWCDTKHTWELNLEDEVNVEEMTNKSAETPKWAGMTAQDLLNHVKEKEYTANHIVITGGEPCMYDLTELCELFEDQGYTCQIETSGTFKVVTTPKCWVTVSPKVNMKGGYEILSSAMNRANEIKHPVATDQHVDDLLALLKEHGVEDKPVYLQPISQKQRATQLAIDTCIKHNWRLSIQVHKYIGIE